MNSIEEERKICKKCGEVKIISLFGHEKRIKSGRSNRCKACIKENVQLYAKNNSKYIQKMRERYYYDNQEEILLQKKEYLKNLSPKAKIKRTLDLKKHNEKYPNRHKARILLIAAVNHGELIRPAECSVCKVKCTPDGHHDNYSKPLEVRWLCKRCHASWHSNNKTID